MERAQKCRLLASVTMDQGLTDSLHRTADGYVEQANRLPSEPVDDPEPSG
jgi:hypothetical protein